MVSFELDGKVYKTPANWSEVKFSKFLTYLETIATKCPKCLSDVSDSEDSVKAFKELSNRDKGKCYEYFALVVGYWVGLDAEVIKQSLDIKTQLEPAYFAINIVLSLDSIEYDSNFVSFSIGNQEYFLPQRYMEGSTVGEFVEAAQFEENMQAVENGNILALIDVMVVLCRPKGEVYEYNEQRHNIRKKLFSNLTMDIVFNVGFFLLKLKKELGLDLAIYTIAQELALKEIEQLQVLTDGI